MRIEVNKMVKLAVLSALGVVLMLLIRFPIIPTATFLEYDPADVPSLIGTFIFGPGSGLIITVIVSIIQAMTVSAGSGWVGGMMHIVATGTMVVVAGVIYKRIHTLKGAIIALIAGSLSMALVMVPLNLYVTPKFLGVPVDAVKSMLLPAIIPFNLIKSFGNSIFTALVYKSVGRILRAQPARIAGKTQEV